MDEKKKLYVKKILLMLLANSLIGISIAFLRFSNFGTDPYNCMNLGVSSHLPISYGTYQLIVNIVLFIPLVILKPSIFGIGALVNMFCVAYIVDGCTYIAGKAGITIDGLNSNYPVRIMLLILGIVILCYGIALYLKCDMGTAPYDAVSTVIDERSKGKLPFKWVRIGTDLTCMGIGFASGSVVGIGTVIVAFFTGPLVSFFRNKIKL